MKKTIAMMLALILMLALIPGAGASGEDYTVKIRGGNVSDTTVEIDGMPYFKVDVFFDGVTDDMLLTALSFQIEYDPEQIEYAFSSQDLGETSLEAVNSGGASMGSRSMLVKDTDADKGELSFYFATDYGCRIRDDMPLISLYFYLEYDLEIGTQIEFSFGEETEAESVRMSEQTGWGEYVMRTVGDDFSAFTVNEEQTGILVNAEVEINSADVELKGTTPYVIYNGKAHKPRVIVHDADTGETIDPMYYTVSYRKNIAAGTANATVRFCRGYIGKATGWFKIYLPSPNRPEVENAENGIVVSWNAVEGAKGYVIYRRAWNLISSGWTKFERWNNTTDTTWTDTKVYAGTRYQYGIKAYPEDPMDNYNLGEVSDLKTTVRITTRQLNSVTAGSRKMTVKWSGSNKFTGYEIQYAMDQNFTKNAKIVKISNPKTYQRVIRSLTAGKTYYVHVRSYHIFEGVTYYGGWSNVLSCRV